MNNEHPNIAVLKRFNPADIAASSEVLAEDVVFHYFNPKLPDMQGDYVGLKGIQMFFEKMATFTKGTFKVNPVSISTFGDELVVVHSKNTLSVENELLEVDALVVWRIIDGKINEAWDIPAVYKVKIIEHNFKP